MSPPTRVKRSEGKTRSSTDSATLDNAAASTVLRDSPPGRGSLLPARTTPDPRALRRHRRRRSPQGRRTPTFRRCAGAELLAPAVAVGRRPRSRPGGEAAGRTCRGAAANRSSRRGSRRRRRSPSGNRRCVADLHGRQDRERRSVRALDEADRRSRIAGVRARHRGRSVAPDRCVALKRPRARVHGLPPSSVAAVLERHRHGAPSPDPAPSGVARRASRSPGIGRPFTVSLVLSNATTRKGDSVYKRTLLTALSLVALAAVVATTATAANAKKASRKAARRPGRGLLTAGGRRRRKAEQGLLRRSRTPVPEPRGEWGRLPADRTDDPPESGSLPRRLRARRGREVPGLIVLLSTTTVGAKNAQNLANLFNLTGFTNQKTNEIWDTWIVGAPSFGRTSTRCCGSRSRPTRTRTGSTTTHRPSFPMRTATVASTRSTSRRTALPRTSLSCRSRSTTELHRRVSAEPTADAERRARAERGPSTVLGFEVRPGSTYPRSPSQTLWRGHDPARVVPSAYVFLPRARAHTRRTTAAGGCPPHPSAIAMGVGPDRGRSRGRTPYLSPSRARARTRGHDRLEGTPPRRFLRSTWDLFRRLATRRAESPGRSELSRLQTVAGSLRNSAERHHDERPRLNRHYASPPCRPARRGRADVDATTSTPRSACCSGRRRRRLRDCVDFASVDEGCWALDAAVDDDGQLPGSQP